jgi:UDP-N-acetylmuramate dehydrogenase
MTTLGLGGPARCFAEAASDDAVRALLTHGAQAGLPVHILGGGSNTVFADAGYPGLVVRLASRGMDFSRAGHRVRAVVAAGETWDDLVAACVDRGYAGLECLSGIPGQVGASPIQNVGAYGQAVAETIVEVRALERHSGRPVCFAAADCRFGYRQSRFRQQDAGRFVVTQVVFELTPGAAPTVQYPELQQQLERQGRLAAAAAGGPAALAMVRDTVLAVRRAKSMVFDPRDPDSRSAGSFFINPVVSDAQWQRLRAALAEPDAMPSYPTPGGRKVPAAWLIEQAGFVRGWRHGGVGISPQHALALVNYQGTATELLDLADAIQTAVWQRFGVQLQREPVVVATHAACDLGPS